MKKVAGGILGILLLLVIGSAWALSTGDSGALWVQASSTQKNQVVNILSRELSMDPGKLQACLYKLFSDPESAKMSIRDAAKQCKEEERK